LAPVTLAPRADEAGGPPPKFHEVPGNLRVLISTLSRRVSKWLRRDLPKRIEALGVPVEVVSSDEHERLGDLLADAERSGLPPAGLGGA
jgi:hypothetical protein